MRLLASIRDRALRNPLLTKLRDSPVVSRVHWFAREVITQFTVLDLLSSAAALTYMTLFAIVPMMTVGYTFLSVMPEFADLGDQIRDFIFANFVPAMSEVIEERLVEFSEQATQLTIMGFAFLVVVAFSMLVSIEQAFNRIWNVIEPRRGLHKFLTYWAVLTFAPPLLAGGLLITSYMVSLPLVIDIDAFGIRERVLAVLPLLFSAAAFTILYYAVPNCRVPLRHALYGGALTAVALHIAQQAFAMMVMNMNVQHIYGAFAAVPLFLTWIYIIWVTILCGAIFVRTLSLKQESVVESTEPPLVSCLKILHLLYGAHMDGRTLTELEISQAVPMPLRERERVFGVLGRLNLCTRTDDDGLALARNLRTIRLWDLYQQLPDGVDAASVGNLETLPDVAELLRGFAADGRDRLGQNLEALFDQHAKGAAA
jgi:membrane protein